MKNALTILGIVATTVLHAQTLYVPGGTPTGIGNNTTNGNVGIGTSSPRSKLEVAGSKALDWFDADATKGTGLVTIGDLGSSGSLFINTPTHTPYYSSGLGIDGAYNSDTRMSQINLKAFGVKWPSWHSSMAFHVTDGNNLSEAMRIDYTGYVGVGVSSPTSKLHLNGDIRLSGSSRKLIVGTESDVSDYLLLQDVGAGSPAFQWVHDGSPKFNIEGTTGNVGIGVTLPSNKLHINGDIRLSGSSRKLIVGSEGAIDDYLMVQDVGSGSAAMQWVQDGTPKFSIEGVTGNVGIGTTTPDAKLAVKGNIHTQEVKVDMQGAMGPDYVFEKDYNLLPLSEVERYIKQNKHLPEVPSAKEMEQDGLNLKEMNLLLLKKVEELTLHLIEQTKKIEQQQDLILKQNERIFNLENLKH